MTVSMQFDECENDAQQQAAGQTARERIVLTLRSWLLESSEKVVSER